ncbi:SNF2-like helicase [Catovirus CTV1]|uniref:SNF2-like helicase n=1 Tax=Catovirus CTV1 TaxID=1977631 RepID=A0A1V0SB06_9VIRU|nr:SNF2-like helicase [Catovirus CTV1]
MKYPKIEDNNFYEKINKLFSYYKTPKKKKSFDEICFPKEFKLQLPQLFVSHFIHPNTPYKGLLVYHKIGSGKSITAIRVAEEWKHYKKIMVLVPASLKGNFRGELRTPATGNEYLKKEEREKLSKLQPNDSEYTEIIKKSDERIDKYYTIYSYNKFTELALDGKINLKNTLLIIDEIQNMVSEEGNFYNVLYEQISNAPKDLRIILLSATPMFDKPHEIALTMNLLRLPKEMPTGRKFDKSFIQIKKTVSGKYNYHLKNVDQFKQYIRGYISYFQGAPSYVFPETKIKYIKCEMSDFQFQAYRDVIRGEERNYDMSRIKYDIAEELSVRDLPNNFFIGTRIVSNIVFPNKKINEAGYNSLKEKHIKEQLEKYSIKFFKIIKKIRKKEKIFIYSGFKGYGGIKSLVKVLETFGYKNYLEHGQGTKRFALWTGDQNIKQKNEIKAIYNQKSNMDGSKLKIIIGSSAIKEGVSLLGLKQIHILEPYWNFQRLFQVIGRGSRFCSHKDLPIEERYLNVYIYVATREEIETVDLYLNYLAKQKLKLVREFEKIVKEAAIDCELNYYANINENEEPIVCDK